MKLKIILLCCTYQKTDTSTYDFETVEQVPLQIERFNFFILGMTSEFERVQDKFKKILGFWGKNI